MSERDKGFITWFAGGKPTWTLFASGLAADPVSEIDRRIIPEEPMVNCLFMRVLFILIRSILDYYSQPRHLPIISTPGFQEP